MLNTAFINNYHNNSMQPAKTTAKDFFLHLGMLVSLYAGVGFVLNLFFSIINTAYPVVGSYYSYANISFPVAALIILTPVFLILASLIAKAEMFDASKKEIWVKRWSTYLTMFLTGAVAVGDLITVLYVFLDGQDLTKAFILKVLVVFVVSAALFGYFLSDLRGALNSKTRMIWRVGAIVLVAVPIILGFMVIGSPRTQRLARVDEQKVRDLQSIQAEVISYFQSKGAVPSSLADLQKSSLYFVPPTDIDAGVPYEYKMLQNNSFELCAGFNVESKNKNNTSYPSMYGAVDENWTHGSGRVCFTRTIDPQRYPRVMPVDKGQM
jgi:Domain of unknown function (DUF5671)